MCTAEKIKLTDGTIINGPTFDFTELGRRGFIVIYSKKMGLPKTYINIDYVLMISEIMEIVK